MRQHDQLKPVQRFTNNRISLFCLVFLPVIILVSQIGCDTGAYEKRIRERQDELLYGDDYDDEESAASPNSMEMETASSSGQNRRSEESPARFGRRFFIVVIIADASCLPNSCGVNPMITIMSLAAMLSEQWDVQ